MINYLVQFIGFVICGILMLTEQHEYVMCKICKTVDINKVAHADDIGKVVDFGEVVGVEGIIEIDKVIDLSEVVDFGIVLL